jgi:4-hydroxy-tetrahydrodipicolinate synthase
MISVDEAKQALTGPVASVSVPFCKDGAIDYRGLKNCVDFIIEAGSGVVLLTYGDSLFNILTDLEISEITKNVTKQTRGRTVVVAAGRWWTGEAVKFARYAREIGVSIFMALAPEWANCTNAQTLAQYYWTISKEIPLMLVTSLASNKVLPLETVRLLMQEDTGIVAVKDDVCGSYGRRLANLINGKWALLSGGGKENFLDLMPYGGDGYLSVYMRFKPTVAKDFWRSIKANDLKKAKAIITLYEMPFFEDIKVKIGVDDDALVHAALEIFGVAGRWRREPFCNMDDGQMEQMREFFKERNLL